MRSEERIELLQKRLTDHHLAGALLFYSRDIFYYSGTAQPAYLAVFPDDYILFIRSGIDFAAREVFIDRSKISEERRLNHIHGEILGRLKGKRIGMELDVLPVTQYNEFRSLFQDIEFVDISPLILEQRARKDDFEIGKIKKSCEAVHEGHKAILNTLRHGITELELSAAIENAHRLAGHEGIFFMRHPDFFMSRGPIASGSNLNRFSGVVFSISGVGLSPAVPGGPSRKAISRGDLIVVDIPTLVDGYHADQSRTYVLGRPGKGVKRLFDDLKRIQDHLIEKIRPGISCSQIFRMAEERAEACGASDAFLRFTGGRQSHMVGHGIGLEISEPPILSRHNEAMVQERSVLALELHLFREDVGIVKLEDMILVRQQGNELLTRSPRELIEID